MIKQLLPNAIFLVCIGTILITIIILKKYYRLKGKRSPFTQHLLRSPGGTILSQLNDISFNIDFYLQTSMLVPILFYATYISHLYFGNATRNILTELIYFVSGFGYFVYSLVKLIGLIGRRRKLRLGLEGEMAVGQELNLLMRDGYHVFHDFPADGFNIDHIVLGPSGVFAIETKARSKPTSKNRTADAQVIYDGKKLEFPNWTETAPLDQASRQATWLAKWLANAAGEQVQVRPVVTLPGWFVKRTSSEGFPVINPKQFRAIAKPVNGQILSDAQIKRIVYQLDQKCRDIKPMSNDGFGGAPAIETQKSS